MDLLFALVRSHTQALSWYSAPEMNFPCLRNGPFGGEQWSVRLLACFSNKHTQGTKPFLIFIKTVNNSKIGNEFWNIKQRTYFCGTRLLRGIR